MFSDYSFADLASIMVMQGFAGLSLFAVFVLMSLGLAIIFGQMGVINMAHGEFMILGAYVTWLTGKFFSSYLPSLFGLYFFVAMHRRARLAGGEGADPPPLQATAGYAVGHMGPQPDYAAVLPFRFWPT